MTLLHHFLVGMGLCALAAGSASATTYQITGTLSGDLTAYGGSIVITYDATGLPITDRNDITATLSNVSAVADLSSYVSDETLTVSGTHGSGYFSADNEEDGDNVFNFSAGSISGELYIPLDFDGSGELLGVNGDVPSLVFIGGGEASGDYYFGGSSAPVATPEPESLTLLLSGVSASGLAMWGRRQVLRSR